MNKITPDQLKDFIEYSLSLDEPPVNFHYIEDNIGVKEVEKLVEVYLRQFLLLSCFNIRGTLLSCLITGFQLGRLFEVREMELRELEKIR